MVKFFPQNLSCTVPNQNQRTKPVSHFNLIPFSMRCTSHSIDRKREQRSFSRSLQRPHQGEIDTVQVHHSGSRGRSDVSVKVETFSGKSFPVILFFRIYFSIVNGTMLKLNLIWILQIYAEYDKLRSHFICKLHFHQNHTILFKTIVGTVARLLHTKIMYVVNFFPLE